MREWGLADARTLEADVGATRALGGGVSQGSALVVFWGENRLRPNKRMQPTCSGVTVAARGLASLAAPTAPPFTRG